MLNKRFEHFSIEFGSDSDTCGQPKTLQIRIRVDAWSVVTVIKYLCIQTNPDTCRTCPNYLSISSAKILCTQDVFCIDSSCVFFLQSWKCPPLPNLTAGKWSRPECSQTQQLCNSHCTLECVGLKGYTRIENNPTRTCQKSGSVVFHDSLLQRYDGVKT